MDATMTKDEKYQAQLALLRPAIARLRASVMAVVCGLLFGAGLLFATLWLVVQGGPNVGSHLGLLSNYYPGYSVTWLGGLVGFFYGALTGAVVGYATTFLYNTLAFRRKSPAP
jgi:hypothetical protein